MNKPIKSDKVCYCVCGHKKGRHYLNVDGKREYCIDCGCMEYEKAREEKRK